MGTPKVEGCKRVVIYTDGACIGNPGPGGYGVLLIYGDHRKELSGGFRRTTNNRMEILAAIVGLKALKKPCEVTIYSDSQYLVKAMQEGWAAKWRENGWIRNKKKEKAVNPDLWSDLLDVCQSHEVEFKWLRGHVGHPGNERADQLAYEAADLEDSNIDDGYESASN